jgi:glycosyltransferase involved in cell wall biosynthesis
MTAPLVSTIIPVYNRARFLREAVESVIAQGWRPIEIIIVDDGSTDETPALIDELVAAHPGIARSLRIPNSGPGPAREAGRQLARGSYLQYLDSDDRLLPGKFEAQVRALESEPQCGIAYGKTRLIDGRGETVKAIYKATGQRHETLFPELLVDRWWCTHTPLYRRSVTDMAGPWSDLRYSQDWEYDARIGAKNVRLAYCDAFVSEHRTHDQLSQTGHGKWLSGPGRVRFFRSLLSSAREAGVPADAPQLAHFARWAFHHARASGALGDSAGADALINIALDASGGDGSDMTFYRTLARVVGWRFLGNLAGAAGRLSGRRKGGRTLPQSWMADG